MILSGDTKTLVLFTSEVPSKSGKKPVSSDVQGNLIIFNIKKNKILNSIKFKTQNQILPLIFD